MSYQCVGSIPLKAIILVSSILFPWKILRLCWLNFTLNTVDLYADSMVSVLKFLLIEVFPCLVNLHFCIILFICMMNKVKTDVMMCLFQTQP
jgi:hypothetical protein